MQIIEQDISSVNKIRITVSPNDQQIRFKSHPDNPQKQDALEICKLLVHKFAEYKNSMRGTITMKRNKPIQVCLYNDSKKFKSVIYVSEDMQIIE